MIHKDENGAIGQIQADGSLEMGDSANWTGHYVYLSNDETNFPFVEFFEVKPGGYVRHPDPKKTILGFGAYYRNPWDGCISRDQLTGILAALIAKKDKMAILRILAHHALRLFLFSYNTIENGKDPLKSKRKIPDLTLFDVWALELRALMKIIGIFGIIFYPLLCILDLHLLASTLFFNSKYDHDPDAISFALKVIISNEIYKTPTSMLISKILNKQKLKGFIYAYWGGWRQNEGMIKYYIDKIKKL